MELSRTPLLSPDDLINLTMVNEQEVAFRAAWILEQVAIDHLENFKLFLAEFIETYLAQRNPSCQRHFTKIMMYLTDENNRESVFSDIDPDPIIEVTFEWLINPETPVAVQCNCMDILYNFKDQADWLQLELSEQVGFLLKNGSAALQSRGKRVLKKLSSK